LKEMMASSKGSYKVLLHLMDGKNQETLIALSDQYKVDPNPEFQNHIKNLFKSLLISFE